MAGMSTRDILKEEIQAMDEGMKRLSKTKDDIWQDELLYSLNLIGFSHLIPIAYIFFPFLV